MKLEKKKELMLLKIIKNDYIILIQTVFNQVFRIFQKFIMSILRIDLHLRIHFSSTDHQPISS